VKKDKVNIFSLLTYTGAGLSMMLLAFYWTKDHLASFLAGFIYMFSHFVLTQHFIGHMGESNIFFLPILLLGYFKFQNKQTIFHWMLLLIGIVGISLTTPYMVFTALIIGLPTVMVAERKKILCMPDKKVFFAGMGSAMLLGFICGLLAYMPLIMEKDLIGGSEKYALSLLSFLDYPMWHPSLIIQGLREFTSGLAINEAALTSSWIGRRDLLSLATPEDLMGFFGLTLLSLLIFGAWKKAFKGNAVWVYLIIVGVVLSLGPFLKIYYKETKIPLPYLIFSNIPVLSSFRVPSRLILLAWMGAAILAAISFKTLVYPMKTRSRKYIVFVFILVAYSWEMGLGSINSWTTSLNSGRAYQFIKKAPGKGGILELPVSINKKGDISINAQSFMLHQPLHEKPLVLGRPHRHTGGSLVFCETVDFVYELTHPVVISNLYTDPKLKDRRDLLKMEGRKILRKNNIDFVLLHTRNRFFLKRDS